MNKRQIGGALPLVVFALTALLGVAALAIDLNMMTLARQRAQNLADAAALAGAQAPGAESSAALAVINANSAGGTALGGVTTVVNADQSVTVRGYVNAPLSFSPIVGYAPQAQDGTRNTLSVFADATAAMPAVCGLPPGMPVAPFGLIGDDQANPDPAVAYVSALLSGAKTLTPGVYQPVSTRQTLKLNVWDTTGKLVLPGSFDPLVTSGSGASYLNTIRQASDQTLFAGQTLPTLSGNTISQTQLGVAARLSPSNTSYTHTSATYDAWFNGSQEQTEGHLLLVPVVSQAVKNKPGNVTIIAFAVFFVEQPYQNQSTNAIALGRFLGLTIPAGTGGGCVGAGGKTPPRLVQ